MKIGIAALSSLLLCLGVTPSSIASIRPIPRPVPAASRVQSVTKVHRATGEVLSASPGSLVLLHARGRTKQRMDFVLTTATKNRAGAIKGERVTVFYRETGGRRIATRIRSAFPAGPARRFGPAKPKT